MINNIFQFLLSVGCMVLFVAAIFIIAFEYAYQATYKMSGFTAYMVKKRSIKNIEKILRKGWEIDDFGGAKKNNKGQIEIYLKISNKKANLWTNDYVVVDKKGLIIKESFNEKCKLYEKK